MPPLAPIYSSDEIRAIEATAPGGSLMERAGLAAAERARAIVGDRGPDVLVLAGPGNNGGDAFEVAVHLREWFYRVTVVLAGDAARLPRDGARALAKWRNAGGELLGTLPRGRAFDLVIDGLFGIGLTRPVAGPHAALIEAANGLGAPLLSLDIPSGLDSDTGAVLGTAARATHTITFIGLKPGLLTLDGPDHCGNLTCDTLGLDVESLHVARGRYLDERVLEERPAPRPRNFHKGRAGTLAIIGGANGMVGAGLLAGRAALKCGVGKAFLGLLADDAPAVDPAQPELMIRPVSALLADDAAGALAVGPGMGTDREAQRILTQCLRLAVPLVIDADALNQIAAYSGLAGALAGRTAPTVLTPHPAEAARLLRVETAAIQADRLGAARELASRFHSSVVLKGNGSVLATPEGEWWINGSGNPGMASAGMGDVLTGMLGALLAQGLPVAQAMKLGVYLHGAAADVCVARGLGPLGLTASDVIDAARVLLNISRASESAS